MCAIESPVGPACDVSQPSGDTADALEQNVLQMMLQQLNFTFLWGDFSRWIIPEAVQLIQVFFLKMLGKECIFLVIFFLLTKPFQAVLLCCALEKGEQKKNQEKCVKQQKLSSRQTNNISVPYGKSSCCAFHIQLGFESTVNVQDSSQNN